MNCELPPKALVKLLQTPGGNALWVVERPGTNRQQSVFPLPVIALMGVTRKDNRCRAWATRVKPRTTIEVLKGYKRVKDLPLNCPWRQVTIDIQPLLELATRFGWSSDADTLGARVSSIYRWASSRKCPIMSRDFSRDKRRLGALLWISHHLTIESQEKSAIFAVEDAFSQTGL